MTSSRNEKVKQEPSISGLFLFQGGASLEEEVSTITEVLCF